MGPFEYDRQAWRAAAKVRGGTSTPERTAFITDALEALRIGLGNHDRHIARWLSMWEPETVATILDWIHRAYEAGATSGAQRFFLTARLNRVPTDEQIDAIYEAGLSDSSLEYDAQDAELDVSRVAYTREEAEATIRAQVATVQGLDVIEVTDTPNEFEGGAR
jgi:hypothetical protein